ARQGPVRTPSWRRPHNSAAVRPTRHATGDAPWLPVAAGRNAPPGVRPPPWALKIEPASGGSPSNTLHWSNAGPLAAAVPGPSLRSSLPAWALHQAGSYLGCEKLIAYPRRMMLQPNTSGSCRGPRTDPPDHFTAAPGAS